MMLNNGEQWLIWWLMLANTVSWWWIVINSGSYVKTNKACNFLISPILEQNIDICLSLQAASNIVGLNTWGPGAYKQMNGTITSKNGDRNQKEPMKLGGGFKRIRWTKQCLILEYNRTTVGGIKSHCDPLRRSTSFWWMDSPWEWSLFFAFLCRPKEFEIFRNDFWFSWMSIIDHYWVCFRPSLTIIKYVKHCETIEHS